ncbi:probable glutamate--tRNA ligase, mitochondrial [Drosophila grimshawi]|uniref:Nondiscriminating glutamyl-tRNA synthetase EARS2, mitochondrial n=1 Tax=Drosophila grimshawi TaxID=7222 RepID=B4J0V6_DROGR|nr:probable glutamate--tRNA ligase, mitochondrial [Drosophila grimshawi]EDV95777.1 GH15589 [Drosophila grimshawi]
MLNVQRAKILRHCIRLATQRLCHTDVRVRFAPSPTGYLHLGGLRTALYNYLFARHSGGKFLLRIEDTDQTRLVPGATERLIEDLLWVGIEIDEGPGFGGTQGPYIQSQRRQLYSEAVERLLANGSAYRCFCTERRLELLRKEALRTRQVPRYDNKCRHLTREQLESLLAKGTPHCIRFKLTEHEEPLQDLIYGSVQHNVSETEGDPVIIKSDQFPTYHLANVVDDHLMGITHVLRGVEWQISTTKHLLLYKAFGWQPPQFGHLPLLVNADGTKLSKRQGDIGIEQFRSRGYFPTALLNYIISAGGGFEHRPNAKPELLPVAQLAQQFRLERVNPHPSRLNADLLNDYNQLEIRQRLQGAETQLQLIRHVQQLVKQTYPAHSNLDLGEAHILAVLQWAAQRLTLIQDLTNSKLSFLWVKPSNFVLKDLSTAQLEQLLLQLNALSDFHKDPLNATLKTYATSTGIKFPALMKELRGALSGLQEGPGVAEMMEILGKAVVLQRLGESIKKQSQLKQHQL